MPAILAVIWRVLLAIPGIVSIIEKVIGMGVIIWQKYKDQQRAKWDAEKEAATKALEAARTPEEKINAAKRLQDLLARIP